MNASENWARESWDRDMRGDLYPGLVAPIVRLPDPEDYPEGSLRAAAVRVGELGAAHPARERGRLMLERIGRDLEAVDEWLLDVGHPRTDAPAAWWDDDTDWRTDKW